MTTRFGDRIALEQPVANPHLSDEMRLYDHEFWLMVYCPWRIREGGWGLSGSQDSNEPDGVMLAGLAQLDGKRVLQVSFHEPFGDLTVVFDGGLMLQLFCDSMDPDERFSRYAFSSRGTVYSVESNGTLESQTVRPPEGP